jgi:hypothetical protein
MCLKKNHSLNVNHPWPGSSMKIYIIQETDRRQSREKKTPEMSRLGLMVDGLWCLMPLSTIFQFYLSMVLTWKRSLTHQLYIVVVSFIGGGNRRETRQFGTKTFRHPLKKTVRHQDISGPRHFGTRWKPVTCNVYFMTRYAKRTLKYSHSENFNLLPYVE